MKKILLLGFLLVAPFAFAQDFPIAGDSLSSKFQPKTGVQNLIIEKVIIPEAKRVHQCESPINVVSATFAYFYDENGQPIANQILIKKGQTVPEWSEDWTVKACGKELGYLVTIKPDKTAPEGAKVSGCIVFSRD